VFDPFDLTSLEVRYQGRSMGTGVPHRIGRHIHPQARPDLPLPPVTKTGVDYLALVAEQHRAQLAVRINYHDLSASQPADSAHDGASGTDPAPDPELEAELASFSLLRRQLASPQLPGQLDLTDLTDDHSKGQR